MSVDIAVFPHRQHDCCTLLLIQFKSPITEQQFTAWLNSMSALLQQQKAFMVMYDSEQDLILPDGYRSQEAQWYKANKDQFFKYCKAIVRIAADEQQRQKLDTPAMHKAWQVPYQVVADLAQAQLWIDQLADVDS
ncbi:MULTISPECIES: hypothetical protein [unclassified Acinetobacter]|uniref:hypothetical protein n=1 Tax=unclassified Acinetobacter TaxID=196816 RepID=UPI0035BA455D